MSKQFNDYFNNMNKRKAFELAVYLLTEASDNLEFADKTDHNAIIHMLGTAKYIADSFDLEEKQYIKAEVEKIKFEVNCDILATLDSLKTI